MDRPHVVELAKWAAGMNAAGYQRRWAEDDHSLAWEEFIPEAGGEVDAAYVKEAEVRVRAQVRKRLGRFRGRTREINGRSYISFEDYCCWRGRRVEGDLRGKVVAGLVAANWNRWVEQNGGEGVAQLAGVRVGALRCYVDGYPYHVYRDTAEAERRLKERGQMLERLSSWTLNEPHNDDGFWERETLKHSKPFKQRVGEWKLRTEDLLSRVYTLRNAISSISQRYFDCNEVLFPQQAGELGVLISEVERIVGVFHEHWPLTWSSTGSCGQESVPKTLSFCPATASP